MKLHWRQEREIIAFEQVKAEEQKAERTGDPGKDAELRYGTLMKSRTPASPN